MIDLVQSQHGGKLLVNECPNDLFDRLIRPIFKRFLQPNFIQTPDDSRYCASVTGELALQGLGCRRLCLELATSEK